MFPLSSLSLVQRDVTMVKRQDSSNEFNGMWNYWRVENKKKRKIKHTETRWKINDLISKICHESDGILERFRTEETRRIRCSGVYSMQKNIWKVCTPLGMSSSVRENSDYDLDNNCLFNLTNPSHITANGMLQLFLVYARSISGYFKLLNSRDGGRGKAIRDSMDTLGIVVNSSTMKKTFLWEISSRKLKNNLFLDGCCKQ